MAQVDEYTVPSTSPLTMTALKAALDAMFAAAVTCNRGVDGAAEPQVGMLQWFTSAETETLKVYASDGWKSILFFNTSTGAITFNGNTDGTALYSAFIRTLLDDASASEALTTLGFSEFAKTLIDDATASAALTTLGFSAFAKTLIDDASASAALTTLGFSAFAKTLIDDASASAALTTLGFSAFAKTLIDDASASEALTTLGIETATLTLTNKRITKRVRSITSAAKPTINTDDCDYVDITALATNVTSMTANLSGTPTIGQTLWISIVGTAERTIAWGDKFEGKLLPGKVDNGKRLDVGFIWNAVSSKWRCVAVNHE